MEKLAASVVWSWACWPLVH